MAITSRSQQPPPSGSHPRAPDAPSGPADLGRHASLTSPEAHTPASQASHTALLREGDLQERVPEEVGPQREEEQRAVQAHEVGSVLGRVFGPRSRSGAGENFLTRVDLVELLRIA